MITPLIALTARHCISGSILKPASGMGRTPAIFVGPVRAAFDDSSRYAVVGTALFGETAPSSAGAGPLLDERTEMGRDVAALFLDPENPAYEVVMVRPSTRTAQLFGPIPELQAALWDVPAGWRLGYAGWSTTGGATNRQVAYPDLRAMFHTISRGGATWATEWVEPRLHPGDSGGPLFIERPEGRREVVGVVTGRIDYDGTPTQHWVDLTHPPIRDWLSTLARNYRGRTSRWHTQHGTTADLWYGEADYLGPCIPSADRDCDHWNDSHDNCPAVANPDQLDANDNGRGDPCNSLLRAPSVFGGYDAGTATIHVRWDAVARRGDTYRAKWRFSGGSAPWNTLFDHRTPTALEGGPPELFSFARPSGDESSIAVEVCTVDPDGLEACDSEQFFFEDRTPAPLPPPSCPSGFQHCPGVGCVRWGRCDFIQ